MKRIPLTLGLGLALSLVLPQVASAKQCHQRCNHHRHNGRVVVRQPVCQPRPQAQVLFQVGHRPVNSIYPPARVIQPGYFGNVCPPRRTTYAVPARNYRGVSQAYCR